MRKITNPFAGMEGFHCFGCCKDNDHGVHMDFYEDGDDVVCFWKPDGEYQGWRNTLHGGIQATLLDETAAWVVFRKLQVMGVTSKLELSYRRPVLTTDSQITLRGHITEQKRNLAFVELTLENSKGEVCTTARDRDELQNADAFFFVQIVFLGARRHHTKSIACRAKKSNRFFEKPALKRLTFLLRAYILDVFCLFSIVKLNV